MREAPLNPFSAEVTFIWYSTLFHNALNCNFGSQASIIRPVTGIDTLETLGLNWSAAAQVSHTLHPSAPDRRLNQRRQPNLLVRRTLPPEGFSPVALTCTSSNQPLPSMLAGESTVLPTNLWAAVLEIVKR